MLHAATIVAHADWSVDSRKRWVAVARRDGERWRLAAPAPVGDVATFLARLRWAADGGAVALGVDLPIGLPRAYAAALPERDFLHFLAAMAARPEFFRVCATLSEVGRHRPFYPARGVRGMTRAAHAARSASTPPQDCRAPATAPRPRAGRRAAVLDARCEPVRQGGNRGMAGVAAARAGQRRERQDLAVRWCLPGLLAPGAVALAETYPAEALRHFGIRLKGSKRRQADRSRWPTNWPARSPIWASWRMPCCARP